MLRNSAPIRGRRIKIGQIWQKKNTAQQRQTRCLRPCTWCTRSACAFRPVSIWKKNAKKQRRISHPFSWAFPTSVTLHPQIKNARKAVQIKNKKVHPRFLTHSALFLAIFIDQMMRNGKLQQCKCFPRNWIYVEQAIGGMKGFLHFRTGTANIFHFFCWWHCKRLWPTV